MTTRTGARVYRRAPRPITDGACPHCQKVVQIAPSGRRYAHNADGALCTGSGVMVQHREYTVDLDEAEALRQESIAKGDRWGQRDRSKPANPWSGKA